MTATYLLAVLVAIMAVIELVVTATNGKYGKAFGAMLDVLALVLALLVLGRLT